MPKNKITFNLASIPSRIDSLHETILSVLPQADFINVYLNDFAHIPEFLYHPKIKYFKSQDEVGDLGDAGKFYCVDELEGYIFTIDDDLIYPSNYVETMIAHIERFNRKAVITCHGRLFNHVRPVESIYRDFAAMFACTRSTNESFIHMPGTGVTAFHADTCRPGLCVFEASNMADVWLAIYCQRNAIPVFCLSHPSKWIKESKRYDRNYTIWNFCHGDDSFQTEQINKINNWQLFTCEDSLHYTGL